MTTTPTLFDLEPLVTPEPDAHLTLDERFEIWRTLNPWVYEALEQMTAEQIASGRTHLGMKNFVEVIRFDYNRQTTGDPFKINNSFVSRYVRLLLSDHPEWSYAFNTRALRS